MIDNKRDIKRKYFLASVGDMEYEEGRGII